MKWQPEDQIDLKHFRYIDPNQPLMEEDIFLPTKDFTSVDVFSAGFWFFIFSAGAITFLNLLFFANPEKTNLPPFISILLLLAFAFGVYRTWRGLKNIFIRRKLFQTGRYRNGIFILNDGILLHAYSQIFFVEKKYIRNFQRVEKGRGETPELRMIMQKDEQKPIYVDLMSFQIAYTANDLNRALTHWQNTGVWKI